MKKIILTGVVLLLLILLAVDFYVNRRSDEMATTAGIPTLSDNRAAGTAATNSTASIDESAINTIAQERTTSPEYAAAMKTSTRKKVRQHNTRNQVKTVVPVSAGVASATTDDGGITVIMDKDEPIVVEKANTFTGFVPRAPEKKAFIADTKRKMLHIGLEGGVMHNSYNGNSAQNEMVHVGFFAGILADVAFNDHLSLQPGVRYAMKGTGVENTVMTPNQDVTIKDMITLHYIQVPVNFVVKFGDKENARIIAGAGPYTAYLVKATDKYEMTTTTYGNTNTAARTTATGADNRMDGKSTVSQGQYSVPIGKNDAASANVGTNNGAMRTMDFGLTGFVGVETPGGFFIKAGTEQGLTNVKMSPDGRYSGTNSNFFVSLGAMIGYRK